MTGMEAVGEVTAVGLGLMGRKLGDIVAYAGAPMGSYAEEQILPADKVVTVPSSIEPITAAAIMLKGMTAQFLVRRCFKLIKMKIIFGFLATILIVSLAPFSYASDPSPLQDFCVAVSDSAAAVFVNGKFCKNPNMVVADDFFLSGLNKPGNTSNAVGSWVTPVNVNQLAGLNTLGISAVRIDYAPYGLNPPHTHPRATEILVVLEGTLYVGFVTSNPANPALKNKLFTKYLNPGDVFVFPEGLIHFQFNVGKTNAVAFAGLSSQNPGVITIANAVFGSDPPINPAVLTKAFQVEKNVIDYLQAQFWTNIG
ncbi:hypothetical protein RD792_005214 [Penstemon davidsonii]|uniref:Cupin type-1 domain-containing protein n=1 Tax=Penstemon davidsonii TaxID=160366 RepID=A0ABR0DJL1_9LAMI|nr:hypothetical protein RD792_005214 [Penstemon davidsonii]